MSFTVDHQGFYLREAPFYPLIQEAGSPLASWSNGVVIRLPAGLNEDLDWTAIKTQAESVVAAGKCILWELDLGLSSFVWTPDDLTAFHSFSLGIDHFCADLFPLFKEHTLGVALYRGKLDLSQRFPLSWWESAFSESGASDYTTFCVGLLSDYLHRLVSILPADVIPFVFFDVTEFSSFPEVAHLLFQERFEYISLGLKGAKGPHAGLCWEEGDPAQGYVGAEEKKEVKIVPAMGLFLPDDSQWDSSLSEQMELAISYLNGEGIPYRFIEEGKLTEQWDGLDQILVPSLAVVGLQAKRKFLGFIAAGGSIFYLNGGQAVRIDFAAV